MSRPLLSLPLNVSIPISLTMTINGISMIVVIQSDTDISGLSWMIDTISPVSRTSTFNGTLVSLQFFKSTVTQYNLIPGMVQMEFIGSDLLDYFKSASTGFGEQIEPLPAPIDIGPILTGAGVIGGLAAFVAIMTSV